MKIYKLGEDVIRQKCVPVEPAEINDEMRNFFNEMFDTMDEAQGVGLAGPQVGVSKRFFVNKSRFPRPADFPKTPFSSNKAQNSINCFKIANVSGAYR